jgi:hypothetical protein
MHESHDIGLALEEAAAALRQHLGWQVTVQVAATPRGPTHGPWDDGELELVRDGCRFALRVEYKARLAAADLPRLRAQMQAGQGKRAAPHRILVAPYINPPLARALRDHGIRFVDTAGNLFLDLPGLFAWCTGSRPPPSVRARTEAVATLTYAGLRLAYALLGAPDCVSDPYRALALRAGISLGAVKLTMDYLAQHGFVRDAGERGRVLVNRRDLLDRWVEGYGKRIRRRAWIGRYSPREPGAWRNVRFEPGEACWGGEVAAERLTAALDPAEAILHVRGTPSRVIARNGLRADPAGVLTLLAAFWRCEDETTAGTAPPLVVYADLMSTTSSRNWEAAQPVYERFLRRDIEGD